MYVLRVPSSGRDFDSFYMNDACVMAFYVCVWYTIDRVYTHTSYCVVFLVAVQGRTQDFEKGGYK